MNCPKCHGTMKTVKVADIDIDQCEDCRGLWFDMMEHEHLKSTGIAEQVDTGDPVVGVLRDTQQHIACPRCASPMISMVFPDKPHIHYEACTVCHGLYLDAGEFREYTHESLLERLRSAFGHLLHTS